MYLHTATQKTPTQLINRLTEVERGQIRAANDDRLEYLRQTAFASDMISESDMKIVRTELRAEFAEASKSMTFGRTWNF